MAVPPRFIPPGLAVEVTARTLEGRCLLRPTPEFTRRANAILARTLDLYPVSLHAYTFLSNHLHFEATSVDAELLSRFESHLLGNVARLAQAVTGWKGDVWKRCTPIPILDDLAAEQRFRYVVANSTKEGLVSSPLEWPGPSSARALVTGETVEAEYEHRRDGRVIARVTYPIKLTPLPSWARLSREQRMARAAEMVEDIANEARVERAGRPPLGVDGILAVDPFAPVELDEHPAPLCHATDEQRRAEFLQSRRAFVASHARASEKFREGPDQPAFPPHSFLPTSFHRRS